MKFKLWDSRDKKFVNPKNYFIGCNGLVYTRFDYRPALTGGYIPLFFTGIMDKYNRRLFQSDLFKLFGDILTVDYQAGAFGYWIDKEKTYKQFIPFSFLFSQQLKISNNNRT